MKDLTVFFLLLVILAVFYLYLEQKSLQVIYIEAYNGKRYLVRDQNDKEDAAKLLADYYVQEASHDNTAKAASTTASAQSGRVHACPRTTHHTATRGHA